MTVSAGDFALVYDPSVGESESWYVNDHTFIRDHVGVWHLIGITHAEPMAPHDEKHLAHATAAMLHGPWTKQPFALSTDADAGETHLWAPHVIAHDARYWMFYCGGGVDDTAYRIHLAVSDDCRTWTRSPHNPLVVDGYHARDPMVLRIGNRWVMYYTATSAPAGGQFVVKAVESDDLVRWRTPKVVYTDRRAGTWGGTTESPFVVARGDRYYLFIGPDWGVNVTAYRRTRVLVSDDPFRFAPADEVGSIASHAAEIVADDDGRWWVSHCGWGMGGVYLAPLHWE